ncbi:uncharacterized protein LOC132184316 isoform X2 [Corylus avellana]|uniref:uncharacterized protein LOC132184316 isoform X2 n=1 Tax=Corylus avellana TaxID=13451 RepID=UPI00286BE27A|nr:uncharacterized protein LOC132184316 isoform X2 [Corylus avellana]
MGWRVSSTHLTIISTLSRPKLPVASCPYPMPLPLIAESEDERVVREFAVLLDACEAHLDKSGNTAKMPTIDERFMGMKAAIITNNPSLKSFGAKIGCSVLEFDDLMKNLPCLAELPADVVASKLLNLLGFKEGKTLEISEYDLIFVHIGDGEKVNGERNKAVADDTVYVNALVGGIVQIAQPGSEISSRLHLSLVMSYGNVPEDNDPKLSVLINKDEKNSDLSVLFPRQSYTVRGENPRKDVRHHCPMLIAQWQYGVTRKDMAEAFSFKDFKEHGGVLVIPADRFLHEVAFKLWKAPKYGA